MEADTLTLIKDAGIAGGILASLWLVLKHEEKRHERIASLVEKLIEKLGDKK